MASVSARDSVGAVIRSGSLISRCASTAIAMPVSSWRPISLPYRAAPQGWCVLRDTRHTVPGRRGRASRRVWDWAPSRHSAICRAPVGRTSSPMQAVRRAQQPTAAELSSICLLHRSLLRVRSVQDRPPQGTAARHHAEPHKGNASMGEEGSSGTASQYRAEGTKCGLLKNIAAQASFACAAIQLCRDQRCAFADWT